LVLSIAEDVSAAEMLSALLSLVTLLLFGAGFAGVVLPVITVVFVPFGGTVLRLHANNTKQAAINKKYLFISQS
jgi:hypothetical protein